MVLIGQRPRFGLPPVTREAQIREQLVIPLRFRRDLLQIGMPVGALVVGGGIAGVQASLDLAESGYKVYLVETETGIGGRMAQLDKTFPTNDCSTCIFSPKLVTVGQNPNIELLSYAEIDQVEGEAGNFKVKIRQKGRYIDRNKCKACGDCTVGDAWTLGRQKEMKPVFVVAFEDLIVELNRMKEAGVSAFIGCCCQPFFIKHMDDFEKSGLPGILLDIDNTTCYELDQAKEAYAGQFASQTSINLDLLNAVLNAPVG